MQSALTHGTPAPREASDSGRAGTGAGVDPDAFREAMSRVPAAVTVVTALADDARPHGYTCTSLCSVSLAPPLVLTCVRNDSRTLKAARGRGAFAVNVLRTGRRAVSELFASLEPDKFAHVPWRPGPVLGLPWLSDCAAVLLECSVTQDHTAGDHCVLVGLVESAVPADTGDGPLLYCRRSYGMRPSGAAALDAR